MTARRTLLVALLLAAHAAFAAQPPRPFVTVHAKPPAPASARPAPQPSPATAAPQRSGTPMPKPGANLRPAFNRPGR